VYRITANIVIEAELSEEQLRSLFVQQPAACGEPVKSEAKQRSDADEEYKARLKEQTLEVVALYEEMLGEGPEQLLPAIGTWLGEFEAGTVRDAIAETVAAPIPLRTGRFRVLKERLRVRRFDRLRTPISK